jgi:uncharacterized protein (DUF427 family)
MSERVTLQRMKRIQVALGGATIVDTAGGFVVHETGLPPRYYVPRADVRAQLTDSTDVGVCPWKGTWRHVDLTAGDKRVPQAAWAYYEPTPVCEPIRDFLAFYANKVDRIEAE